MASGPYATLNHGRLTLSEILRDGKNKVKDDCISSSNSSENSSEDDDSLTEDSVHIRMMEHGTTREVESVFGRHSDALRKVHDRVLTKTFFTGIGRNTNDEIFFKRDITTPALKAGILIAAEDATETIDAKARKLICTTISKRPEENSNDGDDADPIVAIEKQVAIDSLKNKHHATVMEKHHSMHMVNKTIGYAQQLPSRPRSAARLIEKAHSHNVDELSTPLSRNIPMETKTGKKCPETSLKYVCTRRQKHNPTPPEQLRPSHIRGNVAIKAAHNLRGSIPSSPTVSKPRETNIFRHRNREREQMLNQPQGEARRSLSEMSLTSTISTQDASNENIERGFDDSDSDEEGKIGISNAARISAGQSKLKSGKRGEDYKYRHIYKRKGIMGIRVQSAEENIQRALGTFICRQPQKAMKEVIAEQLTHAKIEEEKTNTKKDIFQTETTTLSEQERIKMLQMKRMQFRKTFLAHKQEIKDVKNMKPFVWLNTDATAVDNILGGAAAEMRKKSTFGLDKKRQNVQNLAGNHHKLSEEKSSTVYFINHGNFAEFDSTSSYNVEQRSNSKKHLYDLVYDNFYGKAISTIINSPSSGQQNSKYIFSPKTRDRCSFNNDVIGSAPLQVPFSLDIEYAKKNKKEEDQMLHSLNLREKILLGWQDKGEHRDRTIDGINMDDTSTVRLRTEIKSDSREVIKKASDIMTYQKSENGGKSNTRPRPHSIPEETNSTGLNGYDETVSNSAHFAENLATQELLAAGVIKSSIIMTSCSKNVKLTSNNKNGNSVTTPRKNQDKNITIDSRTPIIRAHRRNWNKYAFAGPELEGLENLDLRALMECLIQANSSEKEGGGVAPASTNFNKLDTGGDKSTKRVLSNELVQLFSGFRNLDSDGDGLISGSDLYDYVTRQKKCFGRNENILFTLDTMNEIVFEADDAKRGSLTFDDVKKYYMRLRPVLDEQIRIWENEKRKKTQFAKSQKKNTTQNKSKVEFGNRPGMPYVQLPFIPLLLYRLLLYSSFQDDDQDEEVNILGAFQIFVELYGAKGAEANFELLFITPCINITDDETLGLEVRKLNHVLISTVIPNSWNFTSRFLGHVEQLVASQWKIRGKQ